MDSVNETLPAPAANEAVNPDSEKLGSKLEQIRTELRSLALQREDLRKRIRDLRQALTALVKVFGPVILNEQARGFQARAGYPSSRYPTNVDLCCEILKRSPQWLTVRQIMDVIERESPLALTTFTNPGASLSNALRYLRRRARVESQGDGRGRIKWRWIGEQNGVGRPEPERSSFEMRAAHRRRKRTRLRNRIALARSD